MKYYSADGTWTSRIEKKIAGVLISQKHRAARTLVEMSTFFGGDYQPSNKPNISLPGTGWIEIPPIDSVAAGAIFSNPCSHCRASQRERIPLNANWSLWVKPLFASVKGFFLLIRQMMIISLMRVNCFSQTMQKYVSTFHWRLTKAH